MNKQKLGRLGENLATRYLLGNGYKLLERNFVYLDQQGIKRGELDLIVSKDGRIIFVEVKTLLANQASADFAPEDKVNYKKQRHLIGTAEHWLSRRGKTDLVWQIDVLALKVDLLKRKVKVSHFEDAVAGDWQVRRNSDNIKTLKLVVCPPGAGIF